MVTKTAKKKVVKKATKINNKANTGITMTVKQAQNLQAFAAKNNKVFKFLDTKILALNA